MSQKINFHDQLNQIHLKLDKISAALTNREKPFLNIDEACQYTGIPKPTLYGFTSKGIIPFHKLNGRRVYFEIKDLDNFILKNRIKSNAEIKNEIS